ncbi:MAG: universal stress protein [Clostridia bacterium]|nr:universal stress protein [Clostridia bacterium]
MNICGKEESRWASANRNKKSSGVPFAAVLPRPNRLFGKTVSFLSPAPSPNCTLFSAPPDFPRLEEEIYKAEICTYLARKTGAHIILLQANDYGSRARINVGKMVTHIKAVSEKTGTPISYEIIQAKKDSSKVNREAAERQRDFVADLILLTASREYGLDDLLFGPQERHVIQRALVPVMLVNPREDMFSLCD